jgi:hypothetical protein
MQGGKRRLGCSFDPVRHGLLCREIAGATEAKAIDQKDLFVG